MKAWENATLFIWDTTSHQFWSKKFLHWAQPKQEKKKCTENIDFTWRTFHAMDRFSNMSFFCVFLWVIYSQIRRWNSWTSDHTCIMSVGDSGVKVTVPFTGLSCRFTNRYIIWYRLGMRISTSKMTSGCLNKIMLVFLCQFNIQVTQVLVTSANLIYTWKEGQEWNTI